MKSDAARLLPDMALFVAVGRTKRFVAAAQFLGIPVSTLSRRISELEKRIGLQLLRRSTRNVELTDVGATYYARCVAIIEAAEAAHGELDAQLGKPSGHLRVSATADFAAAYLVPLFSEFSKRYPDISVELDVTPRHVDLVTEHCDVAIRAGARPDTQLISRKLGTAGWGVYASPAFLEEHGPIATPDDLAHRPCVVLVGGSGPKTTWSLTRGDTRTDVRVSGRFRANNLRLLAELAVEGLGVVTIDDCMARDMVARGALVRVLADWTPPRVPIYALTTSRLQPAKTQLFVTCLSDHLIGLEKTSRLSQAPA